ncbi:nonselective cation channel [Diplodia corticola]|uniref:Nonselective cation channel n=1 Tax=Diplodia corticola TaxID=236234 RepID=A0A1J9RBX4_9PEZI|nr:nonselective cation channel [Diplodia corticola]OJD37961.1 nonselective cation channel [Diplodia corticola]
MCRTHLYQSSLCGHCWLQLASRCHADRDLTNCCQYQPDAVNWVNRLPPHRRKLVAVLCPKCMLGSRYDRQLSLMVYGIHHGIKFGAGPSRVDAGCDCLCAVM